VAGFPRSLEPLFRWLFDGDLGVRFFFVISGFIITWLLNAEYHRCGRVSLTKFYVRRALRILPVYFVYLAVLCTIGHFTGYDPGGRVWVSNLTFTSNFVFPIPRPNGHLWSLAVEEQFYLLWPICFVVSYGVAKIRHTAALLALPLFIAPLCRIVTYLHREHPTGNFLFAPFSFFNYADSLALGCICALLIAQPRIWNHELFQGGRRRYFFIAIALIAVPHFLNRLFWCAIFTVPLGNTAQALGVTMLLFQSVRFQAWGPYPLLNTRWMREIGILSYSIYMWQQLFCTNPDTFHLSKVWWMTFPGWLVPAFATAFISYYVLERPVFNLRRRYRDVPHGNERI
jgi:peptidoglycan/LPS O-acetylase OafA/YrhL